MVRMRYICHSGLKKSENSNKMMMFINIPIHFFFIIKFWDLLLIRLTAFYNHLRNEIITSAAIKKHVIEINDNCKYNSFVLCLKIRFFI